MKLSSFVIRKLPEVFFPSSIYIFKFRERADRGVPEFWKQGEEGGESG